MSTGTLPIPTIPKLRHGERLSRDEFHRRYEAMPDIKAELLDGVVYMSSPVSEYHGNPHADLITWMGHYRAFTAGIINGDNTSILLPLDNEPQPDGYLRIAASHGGRTRLDAKGYVVGSPDLIGEVAHSSVGYDQKIKLPIYEREGVREFLLWYVQKRLIEWYVLRSSAFELLPVADDGLIQSEIFPGLWLQASAMVQGDMATVLKTLQQGMATPEYAQFVEQLQRAAGSK